MRLVRLLLGPIVLAAGIVAPATPAAAASGLPCTDRADAARHLNLKVEGERAHGRYSLPRQVAETLVVVTHGYGHTATSWARHMRWMSAELGAIAVAMDFRELEILPDTDGDGLPGSRGLPVMTGAEDTLAAARYFTTRCRSIEQVIAVSVSGGGPMAGLAIAMSREAPRADGKPLFDQWLAIESLTNFVESYLEARAVGTVNQYGAQAREDIERECGGPIEQNPGCYTERTALLRVPEMKAAGLQGVTLVHAVDDGLVPYNQSREFAAALALHRIPLDFYSVGRRSPQSERETTATGYVGSQLDRNYTSPFAGHASEKSTTHIVMVTSFQRLAALVRGHQPGPYREFLVDGHAGTFPG